MPANLFRTRRFLPLFVAQALGALNDNLVKNALVVLVLFRLGRAGPVWVALAGGIFIVPYILFSAIAGELADRLDKSRLVRIVKLGEVALMTLAAAGFVSANLAVLMAVLFGLGVQATFFSPVKYGLLPEHLRPEELVAGNGLIEAGTFLAILAGTIAGGALVLFAHGTTIVAGAGIVVALAGLAGAWWVPAAAAASPDLKPGWDLVRQTVSLLRQARGTRPVWLSILGISWFWVMGGTLLAAFPTMAREVLHANGHVVTLLLAIFSLGIGIGSVTCARLLRGEVTPRLVPFAAFAMAFFTWDFAHAAGAAGFLPDVGSVLTHFAGWRILFDLLLIAFAGGLYSVPLYALMQERAEPSHRARIIAANNVMNAIGMAASAGAVAALTLAGFSATAILELAALLTLLVAIWIVRMMPQEVMRTLLRRYFRLLHGVTVKGLEHYPPPGQRAVVVVNHQSFADGCLVGAVLPGRPMFAVDIHTARRWWARPFLCFVHSFRIDPANPFATRSMVQAVRAGDRLVIFPEGRITTTGALMKAYDGAGLVADKAGAVIVPVRIDGLQFSLLSRLRGKVRRRLFPRLSLTVMPAVPVNVDPGLCGRERRQAVGTLLQSIMERADFLARDSDHTLFTALLDAGSRFGASLPILEDTAREAISYRRLIRGSVVLGRQLACLAPEGGRIGVLLPNANVSLATFFGLQAFGRVPAMLNFTAGAEGLLIACRAAGITTVVSSRGFVARARLERIIGQLKGAVRIVWLEDVRAAIGVGTKLSGLIDSVCARRLPGCRLAPDAPAVVLFTSGSEAEPKGVALSHRNLLANCAQLASVTDFTPADRVFNAMPMFHAFGLTGGTLLPVLCGVRTFLYPSPLNYRTVPELIYDTDTTICFGTDTFLTGWARFAHAYDFHAVRVIFAGAERIREETRRLYAERFGVRVLEGYGATETAPVLALNTPMHARSGTVGKLLPGIDWRLEPVPGIADGGRLWVRGPNVMRGYYRAGRPGELQPLADGWYDTGDIAGIDARGFVTLNGRAKRFAKIAGELVSLAAVEVLAQRVWPEAMHGVIAVADPRKGEQLVLVTNEAKADSAQLLAAAKAAGMAEIAVPRRILRCDALPLLGTGKVDYRSLARLVADDTLKRAA